MIFASQKKHYSLNKITLFVEPKIKKLAEINIRHPCPSAVGRIQLALTRALTTALTAVLTAARKITTNDQNYIKLTHNNSFIEKTDSLHLNN